LEGSWSSVAARLLGAALLQSEKLIAQINEGHVAALASKFEIEQAAIKGQSLFDVADLERHMVEADRTRISGFGHGVLQHVALSRGKPSFA
jgi:hypothetical protein